MAVAKKKLKPKAKPRPRSSSSSSSRLDDEVGADDIYIETGSDDDDAGAREGKIRIRVASVEVEGDLAAIGGALRALSRMLEGR